MLRQPLRPNTSSPPCSGTVGTSLYVHLNRLIRRTGAERRQA
jgi:hypothetical protein